MEAEISPKMYMLTHTHREGGREVVELFMNLGLLQNLIEKPENSLLVVCPVSSTAYTSEFHLFQ